MRTIGLMIGVMLCSAGAVGIVGALCCVWASIGMGRMQTADEFYSIADIGFACLLASSVMAPTGIALLMWLWPKGRATLTNRP